MGLFWKSRKPDPRLVIDDVAAEFHRDGQWWEVNYRRTQFVSYELSMVLPSRAELDAIVDSVQSLKPEMRSRLEKTLTEYGEDLAMKLDDGESYSVDVGDFASDRSFIVSWSGGASWGDLIADFTIKDGAIIEEEWGD